MKISEVIQIIKDHHYKEWNGNAIKPETTRDKVLYGDVDKECTGVVTTIYASVEVIRKAAKMGPDRSSRITVLEPWGSYRLAAG